MYLYPYEGGTHRFYDKGRGRGYFDPCNLTLPLLVPDSDPIFRRYVVVHLYRFSGVGPPTKVWFGSYLCTPDSSSLSSCRPDPTGRSKVSLYILSFPLMSKPIRPMYVWSSPTLSLRFSVRPFVCLYISTSSSFFLSPRLCPKVSVSVLNSPTQSSLVSPSLWVGMGKYTKRGFVRPVGHPKTTGST